MHAAVTSAASAVTLLVAIAFTTTAAAEITGCLSSPSGTPRHFAFGDRPTIPCPLYQRQVTIPTIGGGIQRFKYRMAVIGTVHDVPPDYPFPGADLDQVGVEIGAFQLVLSAYAISPRYTNSPRVYCYFDLDRYAVSGEFKEPPHWLVTRSENVPIEQWEIIFASIGWSGGFDMWKQTETFRSTQVDGTLPGLDFIGTGETLEAIRIRYSTIVERGDLCEIFMEIEYVPDVEAYFDEFEEVGEPGEWGWGGWDIDDFP